MGQDLPEMLSAVLPEKTVRDKELETILEDRFGPDPGVVGLADKDAEIRLIGFGTFKKNQRAARKGRNPQTGEVIDIAASESLAFKSSVKY